MDALVNVRQIAREACQGCSGCMDGYGPELGDDSALVTSLVTKPVTRETVIFGVG